MIHYDGMLACFHNCSTFKLCSYFDLFSLARLNAIFDMLHKGLIVFSNKFDTSHAQLFPINVGYSINLLCIFSIYIMYVCHLIFLHLSCLPISLHNYLLNKYHYMSCLSICLYFVSMPTSLCFIFWVLGV